MTRGISTMNPRLGDVPREAAALDRAITELVDRGYFLARVEIRPMQEDAGMVPGWIFRRGEEEGPSRTSVWEAAHATLELLATQVDEKIVKTKQCLDEMGEEFADLSKLLKELED